MSQKRLIFFERVTLLLLVFTLPFNGLPKQFFLSFFGRDLTNSFFTLGMSLLAIEYIKYRFYVPKKAVLFFLTFYGWDMFCLALGLVFYPYDQSFVNMQSVRVQQVIQAFLPFVSNNAEWPYKIIYFFDTAAPFLRRNMQFCLIAFFVWHLYHDDWKRGFEDVKNAVLALVLLLGAYSVIELSWLKFNSKVAENILVFINPHLYVPATNHGWWPPLLLPGRLRSLLREPSYFGILSSFLLPFLWSWIWERRHKVLYGLLIGYFCLMIAATNSRTAVSITAFELLLLVFSAALIRTADYTRKTIAILCICICGFGVNLINFNSADLKIIPNVLAAEVIQDDSKSKKPADGLILMTPRKYLDDNIGSVMSTNKFSNNSRLAVVLADLNVIRQHPITGVGQNLNGGYMLDALPDFAYHNAEIKVWIDYIENHKKDTYLLKDVFPVLNVYTNLGVSCGIPGILLYIGFIIYPLIKVIRYRKNIHRNPCVILISISLMGLVLSGFSNNEYANCIGIPIGLLWCCLSELRPNEVDSNQKSIQKGTE